MMRRLLTHWIGLRVVVVAVLVSTGYASGEDAAGKNCLFIGHSFFIPVSRSFKALAKDAGVERHSQTEVFRGGKKGAPGSLWGHEPARKRIQSSLDSGKIGLLGMTYASGTNSSIEDYQKWIDYALKKNPKTEVFIGFAWGKTSKEGGQRAIAEYSSSARAYQARVHKEIILKLRALYPKNTITCSYYGMASVELWRMHEAGELPGIDRVGKSKSVYRDGMGHAGEVLLTVVGLVWLNTIYGIDIATVKPAKADFKFDYKAVAAKVIAVDKAHNSAK